MRKEAEENESKDKEKREHVEVENNTEAVIYQTKKLLDEFKDKVDKDTKEKIEAGGGCKGASGEGRESTFVWTVE